MLKLLCAGGTRPLSQNLCCFEHVNKYNCCLRTFTNTVCLRHVASNKCVREKDWRSRKRGVLGRGMRPSRSGKRAASHDFERMHAHASICRKHPLGDGTPKTCGLFVRTNMCVCKYACMHVNVHVYTRVPTVFICAQTQARLPQTLAAPRGHRSAVPSQHGPPHPGSQACRVRPKPTNNNGGMKLLVRGAEAIL